MYSIERGGYNIQIPKYYVNLEELEFKLKSFSYRVRKKDCLDLPEKMYVQRNIELPDEQRLAYEKLKATALILLKNWIASWGFCLMVETSLVDTSPDVYQKR